MPTDANPTPSAGPHAARRFAGVLAASALAALALAWIYVATARMAFLESGYPVWVAKQSLLRACDLGDLAVFGSSRAEAAVIPRGLSQPSVNLSFGATTPVETYFFVRAALRCPHKPSRILLAFSGSEFGHVSPFLWKNAVRFGFLGYGELREIAAVAASLHDTSVDGVDTKDGLRGWPRDALYASGFPPLYFGSLLHGELFRRLETNRRRLASVTRDLGFVPYGGPEAGDLVGDDAGVARFAPLPVQDAYFRRMLDLLAANGVQADFVVPPITESTSALVSATYRTGLRDYLMAYQARYAGFRVVGPVLAAWPDRLFHDRHHLTTAGAAAFTSLLARCLRDEAVDRRAPCDLAWSEAAAQRASE